MKRTRPTTPSTASNAPSYDEYYDDYYYKEYDGCNGRNDCPSNITTDEEGCDAATCRSKTIIRPHKCPNSNLCVEKESECDSCKKDVGGDPNICTEEYCSNITLTWDEELEFGANATYVKCMESKKCILAAQVCDSIPDCPNGEDVKGFSSSEGRRYRLRKSS